MQNKNFLREITEQDFENAYNATLPADRAVIKQTLALNSFIYNEMDSSVELSKKCHERGFSCSIKNKALDFALFFIREDFAPLSSLSSAILLARLAQVEHIYVLYEKELPQTLNSLELCGIQQAYVCTEKLDEKKWQEIMHSMEKVGLRGSVLVFGDSKFKWQTYPYKLWCYDNNVALLKGTECAVHNDLNVDFFRYNIIKEVDIYED